jgi:hypothetical protein
MICDIGGIKLIRIGAKVVRHSRKIVFQMAEVAFPRELFRTILAWKSVRKGTNVNETSPVPENNRNGLEKSSCKPVEQ